MAVDYAALKSGGFMRQKQKDTFSLRLKVIGGRVTSEQLRTIQAVADKFGSGYVHLTSRQGVEIPFIKLQDIDSVKEELAKGGVVPGVCGPRVRTVTACQAGACCPSGCIDAYEIASDLDSRYFGRQLPHKFKFGVTGCQNNCLKAEENDFGVKGGYIINWEKADCILCGVCEKACREGAIKTEGDEITVNESLCNNCGRCVKACPTQAWQGKSGYIVSVGGTFGNEIHKGRELLPIIESKGTLYKVADAVIDFFDSNAKPSERFAKTLERTGWDELETQLKEVVKNG